MAQWIRRLPTEQEILGSSPSTDFFFLLLLLFVYRKKNGVMRESNSRPPAPEAGIIPLDQSPNLERQRSPRWTRTSDLAGWNGPLFHTTRILVEKKVKTGGAGYRSLCILHAKQALYHLSYTPTNNTMQENRVNGPPINVAPLARLAKVEEQGFDPCAC